MTPPRRRRVLSRLLAVLLLGVLGFVVFRDVRGAAPAAPAVVTGVIGSEKLAFFADERVREVLRAEGLEVRADPAGSRQIATAVDLGAYDFAFPSSSPAADKLLATHPGVRTYAPFSSPMAVATFAPIVDLLTEAGVVAPGGTTFDVSRYLELAATGTRWDTLPGNTAFPARKDVLLSTTAPCQSNSAAMYLGIASYVANADAVVAGPAATAAVLPAVQPLFRDQGYLPPTTEVLFEDYLSAGMGRVPMALVYEAQYLAEALSSDPVLPPDARLLYPSPTIFSRHTLVPLTPAGERVGELLTSDPRLATLAAEHGFRPTDPRPFAAAFRDRGLPDPPALVDVVEPPSFDTLEGMLTQLGCGP
ncbi:hypothetical protein [Pseudonocardia sp. MH-G8]|uniref:hypothetical protein n=1 Tax=Pseudonocardia sp. MH-G8 TaxID=1854588 RepID=UPI000B9FDD5C|nr:hypothetical protein [Pseudonocardia sp. MH-G8]OZM83909.1 hypothetical protein CFP66_05580 [Pseudonocardia sp. MH-G8]